MVLFLENSKKSEWDCLNHAKNGFIRLQELWAFHALCGYVIKYPAPMPCQIDPLYFHNAVVVSTTVALGMPQEAFKRQEESEDCDAQAVIALTADLTGIVCCRKFFFNNILPTRSIGDVYVLNQNLMPRKVLDSPDTQQPWSVDCHASYWGSFMSTVSLVNRASAIWKVG